MTSGELWNLLERCTIENGKFPSISTFSSYSRINITTLQKVFKRWLAEGKLTRNGNYYNFPDSKQEEISKKIMSKISVIKLEKDEDKSEEVEKENVEKIPEINSDLLMRIFSGIVGSVLILVSIHFTFDFNKLSLPSFWAFLLSSSVVLFMSMAFVIRGLTVNKLKRFAIMFLWFLGISYSVFTAVSGQFNEQRFYTSKDNSIQNNEISKYYKSELQSLKDKQKDLIHWREQEKDYNYNPDLKMENPGTWKSIKNGVAELSEVEDKISQLNEKIISNIKDVSDENKSVFSWMQETLHISKDLIQLIMILFPSIFIDLCSTVLMDFAFHRRK